MICVILCVHTCLVVLHETDTRGCVNPRELIDHDSSVAQVATCIHNSIAT